MANPFAFFLLRTARDYGTSPHQLALALFGCVMAATSRPSKMQTAPSPMIHFIGNECGTGTITQDAMDTYTVVTNARRMPKRMPCPAQALRYTPRT